MNSMGAINYGTNREFGLTLGFDLGSKLFNPTKEQLADWDCETEEEYEYCFNSVIEDYFETIDWLLGKERFDYFKVELNAGYYEGFWIGVDFNLLWFDCYQDKLNALKETTRLKEFLIKCIKEFGCVAVDSGWVSTYHNQKDTIKALNSAIKAQKLAIKAIKTSKTLTRQEWRKLVGLEG